MKKKLEENKNRKKMAGRIFLLVLFAIYLLLLLTVYWGGKNFGNIGMDEILFTLNMPLEGSGSDFIPLYIKEVLLPVVLVVGVLALIVFCRTKWKVSLEIEHGEDKKKSFTLFPFHMRVWAGVLLFVIGMGQVVSVADQRFALIDFVKNTVQESVIFEDEYVDPNDVAITFPVKKRNLIYILLESGESSLQDQENGGLFDVNYIPEMTQLAMDNVSFSQSDKIEGAAVAPASGWTMAGMVSQFSGVPLKLYEYDDTGTDNSMGEYKHFLPGVTTLGQILENEGYKNYFMIGSDARFSGRDKFMKQHGDYEIWDYYTAIEKGKIDEDYYVWWGYEDQKLYEYAKEELTRISQNEEPFNFTMLTVDTHHVGGYVCPLCENEFDEQYGNVWACASRQVNDFVQWIQQQPFYENTTIVIAGDHCSMDPEFYADYAYEKHHGEVTRKVYNAIINPAIEPVNEKNRMFVTQDMFPTTLGAMGVKIEGDRLGLGTNLFSEEQTLSEKYGYEKLFEEMDKKSAFYNKELLYD